MAEFEIKITGIQEAQKKLYAYSQQLGDRVVIRALTNGARLLQKQARFNAPKRTGSLRRQIVVRKSRLNNGRRTARALGVYITIKRPRGIRSGQAYYGHALEYGWRDRSGKKQPARAFMGRAFDTTKQRAADLAVASIITGANIVAARTGLK